MSDKQLHKAVDAMLADKRIPGGSLDDDEATMLQAAARLRGSRPDAAQPRPDFVDSLARRLRRRPVSTSRRYFLRGAGIAAAAAAVGVGADRILDATVLASHPTQGATGGMLSPDSGVWTKVTTLTALRTTPVVRFATGSVTGFVISNRGVVTAISAVCTHQGCILSAAADSTELVCPCHDQTFGLDGRPNSGDYYLQPLPALQHRVDGDDVLVLVV
ncbi:MAG: Rieske (2Fe-2S) protein [Candidatus Dormibacteraeota bacterium]|nr:Rieske (2Fe-2S) protein [Candidatus Dormibacteraeota bacterium]MBV8445496.1 Rieske (2Fe-2S) protein [Candidatus Dormibacteraeota bacterium]